MVRYQVRLDKAATNEALVRAVYEELHRLEPSGLRSVVSELREIGSFRFAGLSGAT